MIRLLLKLLLNNILDDIACWTQVGVALVGLRSNIIDFPASIVAEAAPGLESSGDRYR